MRKRILSLVLVAVMLVSLFAAYPMTVSAETATDTWDPDSGVYKISTTADMVAFQDAVDAGESFAGKTITLENDIDLSGIADWNGIGRTGSGNDRQPFAGSFDGQGHTISGMKQSEAAPEETPAGLFTFIRVPANGNVFIGNFTLTGQIELTNASNGDKGYSGTVCATVDAGKEGNGGTVTFKNIHSSVNINSKNLMKYIGGFVGFTRHEDGLKPLTLNIESCIYSGTMNFGGKALFSGGFVGWTGNNKAGRTLVINIKDSVFAGKICLNDIASEDLGLLIGYLKGSYSSDSTASVTANIEDVVVLGNMTFYTGDDRAWTNKKYYGVVTGEATGNVSYVNVKNLYYKTFNIPVVDAPIDVIYDMTKPANCDITDSQAMTDEQLAALTEADFDGGMSCKNDGTAAKYYPCPTALLPANGWLETLTAGAFNANDETPMIAIAKDLIAFQDAVDNGNSFAGKTVLLCADIDMSAYSFEGIGETSARPFSGSFDGQGHKITNLTQSISNPDGEGGLFTFVRTPENGSVVIENFTVDGTITVNLTSSGYCVGTVISCVDAGTTGSGGTVTLKDVHSSVTLQVNRPGTNGTATGFGGLVGFTRHATDVKALTLNIDSCVYDGAMNFGCAAYYSGGIMGTAGKNVSNRPLTINITNTVYAGTMNIGMFSDEVSVFVNMTRDGTDYGGTITANIKDCVSTGKILYQTGTTFNDYEFGIATSKLPSSNYKLNVENLYYRPFVIPVSTGERTVEIVQAVTDTSSYTCDAESREMTLDEISELTADDFSADAKLSFKENLLHVYYPCPTGLATNGWVDSLMVASEDGARVLGAQLRYTDPADQYTGIRFVTVFDASKVEGAASADANFGVILISEEKYGALTDKTSIEALRASGVEVKATKATTEDGIVTVKAVVYNIGAENYADGIVAIAYIGDTVASTALTRSIYNVAVSCVEANKDSAEAIKFCEDIIAAVEAAN